MQQRRRGGKRALMDWWPGDCQVGETLSKSSRCDSCPLILRTLYKRGLLHQSGLTSTRQPLQCRCSKMDWSEFCRRFDIKLHRVHHRRNDFTMAKPYCPLLITAHELTLGSIRIRSRHKIDWTVVFIQGNELPASVFVGVRRVKKWNSSPYTVAASISNYFKINLKLIQTPTVHGKPSSLRVARSFRTM